MAVNHRGLPGTDRPPPLAPRTSPKPTMSSVTHRTNRGKRGVPRMMFTLTGPLSSIWSAVCRTSPRSVRPTGFYPASCPIGGVVQGGVRELGAESPPHDGRQGLRGIDGMAAKGVSRGLSDTICRMSGDDDRVIGREQTLRPCAIEQAPPGASPSTRPVCAFLITVA